MGTTLYNTITKSNHFSSFVIMSDKVPIYIGTTKTTDRDVGICRGVKLHAIGCKLHFCFSEIPKFPNKSLFHDFFFFLETEEIVKPTFK